MNNNRSLYFHSLRMKIKLKSIVADIIYNMEYQALKLLDVWVEIYKHLSIIDLYTNKKRISIPNKLAYQAFLLRIINQRRT